MTKGPDDVPPLSPEALAFLARHDDAGEPTPAQLRRVRTRLLSSATEVRAARSWLPPEVWAMAAVLLLAVLGQLLYLALRVPASEPVAAVEPQAPEQRMREAYRVFARADFEVAEKTCASPACTNLGRRISKAFELADRVDTLDEMGLKALTVIDASIATSGRSVVADLVEARRQVLTARAKPEPEPVETTPPQSSETLFNEARAEHRARNYERSVLQAERCVRKYPKAAACWRQLGSSYASIATRDQSISDVEKARRAYEQFLVVAPADDEYVPRVRTILEQAGPRQRPPIADEISVTLHVGGTMDVRLPDSVTRLATGDDSIAAVSVVGGSLRVAGKAPGHTNVLVMFSSGGQTNYDVLVQ